MLQNHIEIGEWFIKLGDQVAEEDIIGSMMTDKAAVELSSPVSGKVYFITNGEPRELWGFIDSILGAAGLPPVEGRVSPKLAYAAGAVLEGWHRLFRLDSEPRMTRFLARELSTSHWFDIGAARRDLDYTPRVSIENGLWRLKASFYGSRRN